MIDKQQLKLHFSKNASTYNQYANVQKKMKNILIELLLQSDIEPEKIKNILEVGCGTGNLTSSLAELFPSAHITAVDIAPGMIDEIKPRFKNTFVDFVCGDIEEIELNNTYDIIISNATFQWFNDTQKTINKLFSSLNKKGILFFSTFGSDTFQELHQCFNKVSEEMSIKKPISPGQSFYTLNELDSLCKTAMENEACDETLVQSKETLEYEYFDNCKDFFNSIKKVGANNSNKNRSGTSPAFIKRVINTYNEDFRENNKVKATYHCLFYQVKLDSGEVCPHLNPS